MVINYFKSLLFVLLILLVGCGQEEEHLHLVTFNVRYDNPRDGINRWENRIPIVKTYLTMESPDIIGMQEVLHNQLLDFQEMLPGYSYVNNSSIFFREDRFNLIDHGQFWLSKTPDVPGSKDWDAAFARIVTWVHLEDNFSGKPVFCFNTHFDHRGTEARIRGVNIMSEKMSEIAGDEPLIAMGDFNISKARPEMYEPLMNTFEENNSLKNSEYIAPVVYSPGATFNGFDPDWRETRASRHAIDFIFVNDHFTVNAYRVDQVMKDDVFISDHWPVVSRVSFNK